MKSWKIWAICALLWAPCALAQSLLPNGQQQFTDANGQPLAGGSVYFYVPATTTPQATYQNSAGTVLNSNPVILNSAGRAIIWGSGLYREVVYDQFGNLVWDQLTFGVGTLLGSNSGSGGTASGYQKFPSGTIIEWGKFNSATGNGDVITLPLAFPTAYTLAVDPGGDSGNITLVNADTTSLSTFTIWTYEWAAGTPGTGIGLSGWGSSAIASFSANATQYAPFTGGGATSGAGAETAAESYAPVTIAISQMYATINATQGFGAAGGAVVTLRDNGASTALTCTMTVGVATCSDTSHTVTVNAGDLLDWEVAASGTVSNATPQLAINYQVGATGVAGTWTATGGLGVGWVAVGY